MPLRYSRKVGSKSGLTRPDANFDEGTLVNVNHGPSDQPQLNSVAAPFQFILIAASVRGTVIKIDTVTGAVLGEYLSAHN